jgi:hypothetical protein
VADARLRSIRILAADGRFQRNLGRAGGGPGEFNGVLLLRPAMAEARSDRDRAYIEASFERSALPSVAPAFTNAVVFRAETWVQLSSADVSASTRYAVVRRDGSQLGQVVFPPRARVLDVGRAFAWGVVADDDGVEQLEKYTLYR